MTAASTPGRLADTVRGFRQRAGLTQREVAGLAGLSAAGIRDLEQGRIAAPRSDTLRRLAAALGLSPAEAAALAAHARRRRGGPDPPAPDRVWIGVLGPPQLRVAGEPVDLGSDAQLALLGLLALAPNQPVSRDRLAERLRATGRGGPGPDGRDPGGPSRNGLAARVARLRRQLRAAGGTPSLVAGGGGYTLRVTERQLDLLAYRALVGRARQQVFAGAYPEACTLFAAAMALWRGDPLAGIAIPDDPAVVGLARQWRSLVAEYATVAVRLGRYGDVEPLLRRVVAADPLHEVAHARLMAVLAATGRQAEALALFDTLRRRLARELGAAPGPPLAEVHRQIVRQQAPPPAPPVRARATLPPDPAGFVGRAADLRWLRARLPPAGSGAVVCLTGPPGVGASRLALHFAHRLITSGRYRDQQLYAALGAADPAAVLASFLRLLGLSDAEIPEDPAGRAARYRERMAGVPALVMLDGAGSAAEVAPLLPAGEQLVLVTGAHPLPVPGARHRRLGPLSDRDARALLRNLLGPARTAREPAAAGTLVTACGRMPGSLVRAGRWLQSHPALSLAAAAARLADPGDPGRGWLTAAGSGRLSG